MRIQINVPVRAERDETERLIEALAPLSGGIWLARDLTTLVHWIVMAASVDLEPDMPDTRLCRAFGLVSVCDQTGQPVFLINEGDTLDWIEPGKILAIREPGHAPGEIRLERLNTLDAQLVNGMSDATPDDSGTRHRILKVCDDHYLPIRRDQLPTGDAAVDEALLTIETTVNARRALVGPAAGTAEVLTQLTRDLIVTLRSCTLHSYVWAAVLQEQIAGLRQTLPR